MAKNYIINEPRLMKEWDKSLNEADGLDPFAITVGSHKRAHWICISCGNHWTAEIKARFRGNGCPVCGRKRAAQSHATASPERSLSIIRPDLLSEWNYEKNGNVSAETVNVGSNQKVFWKCARGHEWEARINKRALYNQGCPFCSNAYKTSFPEQAIYYYLSQQYKATNRDNTAGFEFDVFLQEQAIAVEYDGLYWHSTDFAKKMELRKNEFCAKNNITLFRLKESAEREKGVYQERKAVYYPYDSSYSYLNEALSMLFDMISTATGIPCSTNPDINADRTTIISNFEKMVYETSLAQKPDLVKEWDYESNGNLRPENVRLGSEQKIHWICDKGHRYFSRASHRVNGVGCPVCANKIILPGYNDLQSLNPELANEWHPSLNNALSPDQVSISSNKKVWWQCPSCNNVWQASINSRSSGRGCPACGRQKMIKAQSLTDFEFKQRCLEKKNPAITVIGKYINNYTKIKCKCNNCGHEWISLPDNILKGQGCPKCAKNHRKTNDEFLAIMKELHPTIEVHSQYKGSSMKVHLYCRKCNNEWDATPSNLLRGTGCPICRKKEAGAKRKKAVMQFSKDGIYIAIFPSAEEAAIKLGFKSYKPINAVCNGGKKSAYGYFWKYTE